MSLSGQQAFSRRPSWPMRHRPVWLSLCRLRRLREGRSGHGLQPFALSALVPRGDVRAGCGRCRRRRCGTGIGLRRHRAAAAVVDVLAAIAAAAIASGAVGLPDAGEAAGTLSGATATGITTATAFGVVTICPLGGGDAVGWAAVSLCRKTLLRSISYRRFSKHRTSPWIAGPRRYWRRHWRRMAARCWHWRLSGPLSLRSGRSRSLFCDRCVVAGGGVVVGPAWRGEGLRRRRGGRCCRRRCCCRPAPQKCRFPARIGPGRPRRRALKRHVGGCIWRHAEHGRPLAMNWRIVSKDRAIPCLKKYLYLSIS